MVYLIYSLQCACTLASIIHALSIGLCSKNWPLHMHSYFHAAQVELPALDLAPFTDAYFKGVESKSDKEEGAKKVRDLGFV